MQSAPRRDRADGLRSELLLSTYVHTLEREMIQRPEQMKAMLLPNQAKPVLRQQAPESKPTPSVRASAVATCIQACAGLDPISRMICTSACS
jgi:hypothetical protein